VVKIPRFREYKLAVKRFKPVDKLSGQKFRYIVVDLSQCMNKVKSFPVFRIVFPRKANSLLLLIGLMALSVNVSGQVVTVSEEITMTKDANYDLLGEYGEFVLMSKEYEHEVFIQAFDKKLTQVWERPLKLEGKKPGIVNVYPGKEDIFVFYTLMLKDEMQLMVRKFDATANLKDSLLIKTFKSAGQFPKFKITASDNQKLVALHSLDIESNLSVLYMDLGAFQFLEEHYYDVKAYDFRQNFKEILLSDGGDLFIIMDNSGKISRKADQEIVVIQSGIGSNALAQFDLGLLPYSIQNTLYKVDNKNRRLIGVGQKSERGGNESSGLVLFYLDGSTAQIKGPFEVPYDTESLYDSKNPRKGRSETLGDLFISDLLVRNDGGVVVFSEERKEFERSLYQGRRDFYSMRFAVDYYYEDILVFAINPDGSNHWQKRLQKKQYSFDDDALYSSFYVYNLPSSARLIYNDEIKNENTVSEYIITGSGQFERRNVLNTNRQDLRLQIRNSIQINSTEYIIPSLKRNKLKLVKVSYN
jgi:hypothetical protein